MTLPHGSRCCRRAFSYRRMRPLFHFTAVSAWASGQNYRTPAINEFLQTADFHLVAQARQGGHTVVTYEVPGGSVNRIKIPDACLGLGLGCVLPHELLRRERARFVLGAGAESDGRVRV